jgi:hypothetical protein
LVKGFGNSVAYDLFTEIKNGTINKIIFK